MKQIKPGDFQIVNVRRSYRRWTYFSGAVFFLGQLLGAYISHEVFAKDQGMVAGGLLEVGNYLCKEWDGLAQIGRVDPGHYAFRCKTLAVFPNVEVTLASDIKNIR